MVSVEKPRGRCTARSVMSVAHLRIAAGRQVHANYHIPISNTASGLMVLEPAA